MMSSRAADPMSSNMRRAFKRALFGGGYYHRRLARARFPGVAILCYHGVRGAQESVPFNELHVTSETFARHCKLIAETCNPISVDDLRRTRAGIATLPDRAVVVTFDDGYRGVLDGALPVLERYSVPAVVFTCIDPIRRSRHFWFDTLYRREGEEAVQRAKAAAHAAWQALVRSIDSPADQQEHHRPMTLDELRRLASHPLVEIGGHTLSHPTLALAPAGEQQREIAGCRDVLQELIGRPVRSFAYPYGHPGDDYDDVTSAIVRDAGFDLAFTTAGAFARLSDCAFEIPRFTMLDSVQDAELAHRLLHSWPAAQGPRALSSAETTA
jgi:peptidoglycan/xylan/chitin deacetylase (PgdA/CDA1 family)